MHAIRLTGWVALCVSSAALADQPEMTRVPVTGSRMQLQQEQLAGVGPLLVLDSEAIRQSGAASLETLLQRLPVSAGFAGNQGNAYWTLNGYGTAQVNLRGLGIERTLVLLNGRRLVPGGTGANKVPDLNAIPLAAIRRVEILLDGASAIYGADALAGVVNIITRQGADGLELTAKLGATTRGDGAGRSLDIATGARGATGEWLAALNYAAEDAIPIASRAPCPLALQNGALACLGSSSTAGGRARLADGTRINFNQDPAAPPDSYTRYDPALHGYNSNLALNAVNPVRRLSASAFGAWPLPGNAALSAEFLYTDRQSNQLATPGTLGQFRAINIAATHPTNPTGQDLVLERRRVVEAGPRRFDQHVRTLHLGLDLRGKAAQRWDWTLAGAFGRNTGSDGIANIINLDRVDATLDPSRCGRAAIPCGNYLGAGNLTRNVLDYILSNTVDRGGNQLAQLSAGLGGQVLRLPAGDLTAQLGWEWRHEKGWRTPDPLIVARAANTNAQDPLAGSYRVRELFAEASAPLLADTLSANAAVRHARYSMFGAHTTYKAGLLWQALPGVKVRAIRSSAFRVPALPELFGGVTQGSLVTPDPCSNWSGLPADSVLAQNCKASGVPAGYRQLGQTIITNGGGNRGLQPERGATRNIGLVWTPTPATTATVDYYRITIADAIETVSGATKLATCLNTPGMAHPFCRPASYTRDPATGEVNFLFAGPDNVADQVLSGIDAAAAHHVNAGGARFGLNANVSYLARYDVRPYPGGATLAYAGKITAGRGSYARWRGLAGATAERGPWSVRYTVQVIGKAADMNAAVRGIGDHVPGLAYHSVSATWRASRQLAFLAGVDNLFDRRAPFLQSWIDGNTDTMTYDLAGRRWKAALTYRY